MKVEFSTSFVQEVMRQAMIANMDNWRTDSVLIEETGDEAHEWSELFPPKEIASIKVQLDADMGVVN